VLHSRASSKARKLPLQRLMPLTQQCSGQAQQLMMSSAAARQQQMLL